MGKLSEEADAQCGLWLVCILQVFFRIETGLQVLIEHCADSFWAFSGTSERRDLTSSRSLQSPLQLQQGTTCSVCGSDRSA